MTALLELKQRIKNLYSQYEIYILPVLRFVLAMVYFIWINTNMGYMKQIDNIFIVLILALICSILPSGVMIFVGFALMVAHGYALGIEVQCSDASSYRKRTFVQCVFCTSCRLRSDYLLFYPFYTCTA